MTLRCDAVLCRCVVTLCVFFTLCWDAVLWRRVGPLHTVVWQGFPGSNYVHDTWKMWHHSRTQESKFITLRWKILLLNIFPLPPSRSKINEDIHRRTTWCLWKAGIHFYSKAFFVQHKLGSCKTSWGLLKVEIYVYAHVFPVWTRYIIFLSYFVIQCKLQSLPTVCTAALGLGCGAWAVINWWGKRRSV